MWRTASWGDRSSSTGDRFRTAAPASRWRNWGSESPGIRCRCAGRAGSPKGEGTRRGPLRTPHLPTLKNGMSGQEAASKPSRADIRMEIDVEAARVLQQLGQRQLRGGEVRVGDKHALVLHVDVLLGEHEIHAHGGSEPPDDRARGLPRGQVMDVPEPNGLAALVVDGHRCLDRAVFQNLDLRMPLRFGRAGRELKL